MRGGCDCVLFRNVYLDTVNITESSLLEFSDGMLASPDGYLRDRWIPSQTTFDLIRAGRAVVS